MVGIVRAAGGTFTRSHLPVLHALALIVLRKERPRTRLQWPNWQVLRWIAYMFSNGMCELELNILDSKHASHVRRSWVYHGTFLAYRKAVTT
jgi:hypothetical protein